jgi:hypothetical protein
VGFGQKLTGKEDFPRKGAKAQRRKDAKRCRVSEVFSLRLCVFAWKTFFS